MDAMMRVTLDAMIGLTLDAMMGLTMDAMIYCGGCGGNPPSLSLLLYCILRGKQGHHFSGFSRGILFVTF